MIPRSLILGAAWAALMGLCTALPTPACPADETLFATFSICAIDPITGESGAAVTTRVPFVGRAVPWVEAGVGAAATQSWTVVEYGRRGLDLLKDGVPPAEAIRRLLADDAGADRRQLGLINMKGEAAAFTGAACGAWAGDRQGKNYTVQANIMVGPEVVAAVADSFEQTEGTGMPLAERLILALEAGQARGGDKRWGLFQSAAVKVADPNHPGRGGDHISLAIEVGEHPEPVQELKRIYYRTSGRLGWREFSEIRGSDVIELKRMLHALGYWRQDLAAFPDPPQYDIPESLRTSDPKAYADRLAAFRARRDAFESAFALYDGDAMDAVDAFRQARGLVYEGNARGLVDRRLVEALRQAYYSRPKPPQP
ncbi:MAG: DUF1028 domain-containing protein [Acidobacteria bacterium]|nr:DUF1028 domain-containing protein [Acidobacteriota bacterium]